MGSFGLEKVKGECEQKKCNGIFDLCVYTLFNILDDRDFQSFKSTKPHVFSY